MGHNTIYCQVTGMEELQRRLSLVDERVAKRVVPRALKKGAAPILAQAGHFARTPRTATGMRFGGLAQSLGFVIRTYQQKTLCIMGPLRDRVFTRLGKKEVPANIAHLVEFGHRIAVGGSLARSNRPEPRKRRKAAPRRGASGGFVQGQPFMRPAWDAGKSAAQTAIESELRTGIEEAAK
jgi:hypothetical protein